VSIFAVCFTSSCGTIPLEFEVPPVARTATPTVKPCVTAAQATSPASLIYPQDQETGVDPYAPFSWTPDVNAISYEICVGTTPGATNVWNSGEMTGTVVSVPNLQPNTPYYLRLQVKLADKTFALKDTTFTSGTGLAHFTSPADGAANVDPLGSFAWTGVLDAEMYKISLSTSQPGGTDAYDSGYLPNTNSLANRTLLPSTLFYSTLPPIPVLSPTTKYYARLTTRKGGVSWTVDSTFTTGEGLAHLTSPLNSDGSGNVGPAPYFTWNRVPDADEGNSYCLTIGSFPEKPDVWSSGFISTTGTRVPEGFLKPGTTYYVQLWTKKKGTWKPVDSAFSTGSFDSGSLSGSNILYPPDNATDVEPFAPIIWSSSPGSPDFSLDIGDGTTLGTNYSNYVRVGPTSSTSWRGGLIGGKTYYAKLWTVSRDPGKGCSSATPCLRVHSIKFTTAAHPLPHNPNSFYENVAAATAAVRNMASGVDNSAIDPTFLERNLDPNHHGHADCADFAENLLDQFENREITARRRNMVFGAGPGSHTIVEYYDPIQRTWAVADATYGFLLYDPSKSPPTMSSDQAASALAQGSASTIPHQFVTTTSITPDCPQCFGSYWVEDSLVDPILFYLNPNNVETLLPPLNDPTNSLINVPDAVGVEGVYIFRFANPSDSAVLQEFGIQVVIQPFPTPWSSGKSFGNFSTSMLLGSGWSFVTTPPPGMQIEKSTCPLFVGPNCQ
jgi:hypothetical protein